MIKYILKKNKNTGSPAFGRWYAYPVIEETLNLRQLAKHMAQHNTGFSEAQCLGVMTAMVQCIKEMILDGKNVKIDDLAIFSCGIRNAGGAATEDVGICCGPFEDGPIRLDRVVIARARAGATAAPLVLDDWAVRYPTHVADVADVLAQIVARRLAGTFHWSGDEAMTKLDMGRVAARLLGVDAALLKGSGAPANGSEPRPRDCHLDRSALEARGVSTPGIPFAEAARHLVAKFAR